METIRRITGLLLVAGLMSLAWIRATQPPPDPEELVWAQLNEVVGGFNGQRTRTVRWGFHREFRDHSGGYSREDLLAALQHLWRGSPLEGLDETFRVVCEKDSFELLELVEEPPEAKVRIVLQFYRRDGADWEEWWETSPLLTFRPDQRDHWRISDAYEVQHSTRPRR